MMTKNITFGDSLYDDEEYFLGLFVETRSRLLPRMILSPEVVRREVIWRLIGMMMMMMS